MPHIPPASIPYQSHFFEHPAFQLQLCHQLLELLLFLTQIRHFMACGLTLSIAKQVFLASLQRLFAPVIVKVEVDSLTSIDRCYALFATQACQHNAHLFLGTVFLASHPVVYPDDTITMTQQPSTDC